VSRHAHSHTHTQHTERASITRTRARHHATPRQVSNLQRERTKLAILHEALIVASTLSFAGSAIFQRLGPGHFDVVIVDEAAQAVEPSVMVPLVMGCKQVPCARLCACVCVCVWVCMHVHWHALSVTQVRVR
jgi:hypothetical protein